MLAIVWKVQKHNMRRRTLLLAIVNGGPMSKERHCLQERGIMGEAMRRAEWVSRVGGGRVLGIDGLCAQEREADKTHASRRVQTRRSMLSDACCADDAYGLP